MRVNAREEKCKSLLIKHEEELSFLSLSLSLSLSSRSLRARIFKIQKSC